MGQPIARFARDIPVMIFPCLNPGVRSITEEQTPKTAIESLLLDSIPRIDAQKELRGRKFRLASVFTRITTLKEFIYEIRKTQLSTRTPAAGYYADRCAPNHEGRRPTAS